MKTRIFFISALFPIASYALEVDREVMPAISLEGQVLATIDWKHKQSNNDKEVTLNIDDSEFGAHLEKKMFNNGIAGTAFAFKESDSNVNFNELNVFYWNYDFALRMGRFESPTTVIKLPTLRDEDLMEYTHIGNVSSNQEFDQLYAKSIKANYYIKQSNHSIGAWLSDFRQNDNINKPNGFNYYGAGYEYAPNDDVEYIDRIRHASIAYNAQKISDNVEHKHISSIIGSIDFNINLNPMNNWANGFQFIYNSGLGSITDADISGANAVSNQARAKSYSAVYNIRFTNRPMLLTRWQAGLSIAYKKYDSLTKAHQYSIVPSLFYRLGMGVDCIAQFKHTHYSRGLYNHSTDNTLYLGLRYQFSTHFNKTFTDRNSIINRKLKGMD